MAFNLTLILKTWNCDFSFIKQWIFSKIVSWYCDIAYLQQANTEPGQRKCNCKCNLLDLLRNFLLEKLTWKLVNRKTVKRMVGHYICGCCKSRDQMQRNQSQDVIKTVVKAMLCNIMFNWEKSRCLSLSFIIHFSLLSKLICVKSNQSH